MSEDLVGRIYEAAFAPELWHQILGEIAAATGAAGGTVMLYDGERPVAFRASEAVTPVAEACFSGPGWQTSRRIEHTRDNPFTGFVVAREYFTDGLLDKEIAEGWRTTGFGDQAGTIIGMPSGQVMVVVFDKWAEADPYRAEEKARLNALYPHLARAGLMATQFRLGQAQAATSALATMGVPAAVLSSSGRVRAANGLFESAPVVLPTAFGGVAIADRAANELFRQAIEQGISRSIPIRKRPGTPPMVIHLLPLKGSAHGIFAGADILVAMTTLTPAAGAPSPATLTALFGLAPAEARVAVALSKGQSLQAIAAEHGISFNSARKYLDHVYAKTGTHRQSELVALLKSAPPMAGDRREI